MEKISYHNVFAVVTGVSMIITCCLTAYLFQKKLFRKYRRKVANIAEKNIFDKY